MEIFWWMRGMNVDCFRCSFVLSIIMIYIHFFQLLPLQKHQQQLPVDDDDDDKPWIQNVWIFIYHHRQIFSVCLFVFVFDFINANRKQKESLINFFFQEIKKKNFWKTTNISSTSICSFDHRDNYFEKLNDWWW